MALVKRSLFNTLCRVKGFRGASSQDTRRQFLNDSSWAESIRCCYSNSSHIGGEESVNVHCTYWVVNNTQRLASNADLYLGGRGGLQAVEAKRSTERPLVKVGQVACLQEIKAPHETSRWRRRTSLPPSGSLPALRSRSRRCRRCWSVPRDSARRSRDSPGLWLLGGRGRIVRFTVVTRRCARKVGFY